ncbi:FAD-linked oxidoreductase-like protein [Fomitopsis serialis]|uniref:FAD-linked oxidoreductase-like protein n=1 Tax=Fomitopsis serialis TaxID=139415 RepID=UPI0020076345|nr:FAD-linked oxidoreductase-like protein [Neoantrodia serialis]KAH9911649.1 FAD-linked oxidoreductase-like protein [Neoantrodia serialis]
MSRAELRACLRARVLRPALSITYREASPPIGSDIKPSILQICTHTLCSSHYRLCGRSPNDVAQTGLQATRTPSDDLAACIHASGLVAGGVLTASLVLGNVWGPVHADAPVAEAEKAPGKPQKPLSSLIRSYVVYSMCSIPALVDWAPSILATLTTIPGLKQVTEAIVRVTFFDQFVGGDTAEDCLPLLEQLRAEGKGCLFAYSVEVDEAEAAGNSKERAAAAKEAVRQIFRETLHCIDVGASFEDKHASSADGVKGRKTWVAIKLTAMVPRAETLRNFSKYLVATRRSSSPAILFPGQPHPNDLAVLAFPTGPKGSLSQEDIEDLAQLRDDLRAICKKAQERGVKIIMDAEYSWYQPAVDAFLLSLQREFNALPRRSSWFSKSPAPVTIQPVIYQTYQAYLRRTPEYLKHSIAAAHAEGYALGAKLVRGAYHPHELAAHASASASSGASVEGFGDASGLGISPDREPPVWLTKAETDACYDACAALLLDEVRKDVKRGVPGVGVLFGTHNWKSVGGILEGMEKLGLAKRVDGGAGVLYVPDAVAERIAMGQLYGMTDALSDSIAERTRCSSPFLLKYIPYGALAEVMPYLSRRAIENKSVLGDGAATEERRRAGELIWKRLFG